MYNYHIMIVHAISSYISLPRLFLPGVVVDIDGTFGGLVASILHATVTITDKVVLNLAMQSYQCTQQLKISLLLIL